MGVVKLIVVWQSGCVVYIYIYIERESDEVVRFWSMLVHLVLVVSKQHRTYDSKSSKLISNNFF